MILVISGKTALVSHVPTRWNSAYLMVERAVQLKDAMVLYFSDYYIDKDDILTEDEWKLMTEMLIVLRPLYLVTVELSSEKNTTLSKVIPIANQLQETYLTVKNESPIAKMLRETILDGLKHYFVGIENNEIYTLSTILDPRFKNLGFSTKAKANEATKLAKAEATFVSNENDTNEKNDEHEEADHQDPSSSKNDDFDEFWGTFDAKKPPNPSKRARISDHKKDCIDSEMRKYLSLQKIDRKECPLKWWYQIGSKQFPFLFEASKKYLTMPATSVPSERVFSNAGNVLNKKRSRLGKTTANMLITLHTNMKK